MSDKQYPQYPWLGDKTEKIQIRVTPEEKKRIREICAQKGGVTIGSICCRCIVKTQAKCANNTIRAQAARGKE